jgi:hypothetical protein
MALVVTTAACVSLVARGGIARANGGPVGGEDEPDTLLRDDSGRGDLSPIDDPTVELVSERLAIRLDGESAVVRAEYVLRNTGQAKVVRFGIPVLWDPMRSQDDLMAVSNSIERVQITLDGVVKRCTPFVNMRINFPGPDGTSIVTRGWCVAPIALRAEKETHLRLEYPLDFNFVGIHQPKFVEDGLRGVYVLAPAGYWKGPARDIVLEIDPRTLPWRGNIKVVWPPGFEERSRVLRWHGTNVDLKSLKAIVFDFEWQSPWSDGGWLRRRASYVMEASSTREPRAEERFEATKAADEDFGTSWCGAGLGTPEWLSAAVHVEAVAGRHCRIRDFLLLPGEGHGQSRPNDNTTLPRYRIEDCANPADGFDLELPPSSRHPAAILSTLDPANRAWEIHPPEGILDRAPACVRLRISSAEGLPSHACVSEFVPRVYCRRAVEQPGERKPR